MQQSNTLKRYTLHLRVSLARPSRMESATLIPALHDAEGLLDTDGKS